MSESAWFDAAVLLGGCATLGALGDTLLMRGDRLRMRDHLQERWLALADYVAPDFKQRLLSTVARAGSDRMRPRNALLFGLASVLVTSLVLAFISSPRVWAARLHVDPLGSLSIYLLSLGIQGLGLVSSIRLVNAIRTGRRARAVVNSVAIFALVPATIGGIHAMVNQPYRMARLHAFKSWEQEYGTGAYSMFVQWDLARSDPFTVFFTITPTLCVIGLAVVATSGIAGRAVTALSRAAAQVVGAVSEPEDLDRFRPLTFLGSVLGCSAALLRTIHHFLRT